MLRGARPPTAIFSILPDRRSDAAQVDGPTRRNFRTRDPFTLLVAKKSVTFSARSQRRHIMRVFPILTVGFLALAGATACSTFESIGEDDYVVTSATPDAITLRFREGNLNVATGRADAHCAGTSRKATMVNVMPSGDYSAASFRCE